MDLYAETNLISSEEYTDEEDDFMDEVLIAQNMASAERMMARSLIKSTNRKRGKKSSLAKHKRSNIVRKKNYELIYKKKSITWLNNTIRRQKYKNILMALKNNKHNRIQDQLNLFSGNNQIKNGINVNQCKESIDDNNVVLKGNNENIAKTAVNENTQPFVGAIEINTSNSNPSTKPAPMIDVIEIVDEDQNKDSKQELITITNNSNNDNVNNEDKDRAESTDATTSLYKEINEMFTKHDNIIGKHVKSKSSSVPAVDEIVSRILLDIRTLNNMLHTKEHEWNRLLHLKKVKEEILVRFLRKKHIIEMNEKSLGENYSLNDLNELITNFSKSDSMKVSNNTVPLTTQQLVESRANMKSDDLEKEQINTKRLHSILVSNNILPSTDGIQKYLSRTHKLDSKYTSQASIENEILSKDMGFSADRFKAYNRCNNESDNFSPTLEKILSTVRPKNCSTENNIIPSSFNHDLRFKFSGLQDEQNSSCYKLQNFDNQLSNDVSIIPVNSGKMRMHNNHNSKINFTRPSPNATKIQNFDMETSYENHDSHYNPINIRRTSPICQECRAHESRFVCGGCSNQWYCSRSCQVSAWDKHSETCSG